MNAQDKAKIEAAGYTVNANGQVFEGNRRIKGDMIPFIISGHLVANVNLDYVKKAKQRAAASGGDLVAGLNSISPVIGMLGVGQTARVPMPSKGADGKDPKRSFVMSIVTKLNNVTLKGREWAGRNFDVVSNEDGSHVLIARLPDLSEPKERAAPKARKDKSSEALNESLNKTADQLDGDKQEGDGGEAAVIEGGATVTEHA